MVQKMQQYSILFGRNSHLTLYIYLLVYFASIWYITKDNLRHCLRTFFFQRFKPLKLLSILLSTLCTYLIKNYHNSHLKPHTLKMSVMHN